MNVEFNIRIIEQLDDETDPQQRVDDIAYNIASVLSDLISIEITVIENDAKTIAQMQRLIEDLTEERRQLLKERCQLLQEVVDLSEKLIEEMDFNIEQMKFEANLETILRSPVFKNSRLAIEN